MDVLRKPLEQFFDFDQNHQHLFGLVLFLTKKTVKKICLKIHGGLRN